MKKSKETRGLLKSRKICTLATLFSTILNTIGLSFILTSFGMESQGFATQLQTFGIGAGMGLVGVSLGIACENADKKRKTPSEEVLDMTDKIKKADEDGESKEFLESLKEISEENTYECNAK